MNALVVPRAGTNPGRSAASLVEPSTVGQGVAELGETLDVVGAALEDDYLTREAQRFEVDLTRDMNTLRLEVAAIGDPDQAEQVWQTRSDQLRTQYLDGDQNTGRAPVHEKNRERLGLRFDSLRNQNAFSLGRQTLAARQSQHEANYINYTQVATNAAATADPETRDGLLASGDRMIGELVAAGVIDEAEAERRRIGLRSDVDNARAIRMIDENPAGYIEAANAGDFSGLSAEQAARNLARANGALQVAANQARAQADRDAAALERAIGEDLVAIRQIAEAGRVSQNEEWMTTPEVQAHPEFAKTQAAISLRDEGIALKGMTPAALQDLIVQERGRKIAHKFEADRLEILEATFEAHEEGYAKDPVAYASRQGIAVPYAEGLDLTDPAEFSRGLGERIAWANQMRLEGYTETLRYLSNEEREALKEASSVSADPTARADLAVQMSLALTTADPDLIESYELDPVFVHMGEAQARGVSRRVAIDVFRGQQIIDNKNVELPPARERLDTGYQTLQGLFGNLADGPAIEAQVRAATDALYAQRVQSQDPAGDIDTKIYRQSLHEVMGGVGTYNDRDARGGVQVFRGLSTVMPAGVQATQVESALRGITRIDVPAGSNESRQAMMERAAIHRETVLRNISGGQLPVIGGQTLDAAALAQASILSVGNDVYTFVFATDTGLQQVRGDDGLPYRFSMRRLLREVGK